MSDIGARFVACRRWRWMDRMLDDRGRTVLCVGAGRIDGIPVEWCSANAGHFEDYESPERAKEAWGIATPDTTDPATLGCILALVREAWGRPTMRLTRFHTNVRDDSGAFTVPAVWWRFVDGDEPEPILVETEDRRRYLAGATEAEAMLCALELAP